MDRDGTQDGYDTALLARDLRGGRRSGDRLGRRRRAGHLVDGLRAGADAVLCASIFHYGRYRVGEVKAHLAAEGVPVRIPER
jgi:cyclase